MQRLLLLLILLFVSAWIGILLFQHPGFLLIIYKPWTVQMPLWFAVLSLTVLLICFYYLVTGIDAIKFLWFRLKNWRRLRKEQSSYSKTQHGLALLIEGKYRKAEQLLLAGVQQSVDPLMNYLGAAKAAHAEQAYERRNVYMQKAYEAAPHAKLAIGIVSAEFSLQANQAELAIQTLKPLFVQYPKHAGILRLLERCYIHIGDWHALVKIIPNLRKAKLIASINDFEKHVYLQMLRDPHLVTLPKINSIWQELPKYLKKDPALIATYLEKLLQIDNGSENQLQAKKIIRKVLKNSWQAPLVAIYTELAIDDANEELVIADAWFKTYGAHAELYLLLAKICVNLKLWGKAKDYYQKVLNLGPNPAASYQYGKLLESLNEPETALTVYALGLNEA